MPGILRAVPKEETVKVGPTGSLSSWSWQDSDRWEKHSEGNAWAGGGSYLRRALLRIRLKGKGAMVKA